MRHHLNDSINIAEKHPCVQSYTLSQVNIQKNQWKYTIHLHYHTIMSFQTQQHRPPQVRDTPKFIFVNIAMLVWLRKAMWPISILSFMICWAIGVIFIVDFRKNNSLFPRISLHKLHNTCSMFIICNNSWTIQYMCYCKIKFFFWFSSISEYLQDDTIEVVILELQ